MCYVTNTCRAVDQEANKITVRFYFSPAANSSFTESASSSSPLLTYDSAFRKIVYAFGLPCTTWRRLVSYVKTFVIDEHGGSNILKSDVLFSDGDSLTIRASDVRRRYCPEEDGNPLPSITSIRKLTTSNLLLQLHELFQTLAINCILTADKREFKGAFVEVWDPSRIKVAEFWEEFFAVTMVSKTAVPLYDRLKNDTNSLLCFIDKTRAASSQNIILFDNKPENALYEKTDGGDCYLIDFDVAHTRVVAKTGDGFSTELCYLINSMILLLQVDLVVGENLSSTTTKEDTAKLEYALKLAGDFFKKDLRTFCDTPDYVNETKEFWRVLFKNASDAETIQIINKFEDCNGLLLGRHVTMDEAHIVRRDGTFVVARHGRDRSNKTLAFSYDTSENAVQICFAKRLIFMTSFYCGQGNEEGGRLETPWIKYYVTNMLLQTDTDAKKDMLGHIYEIQQLHNNKRKSDER